MGSGEWGMGNGDLLTTSYHVWLITYHKNFSLVPASPYLRVSQIISL
ncbi:MAG: hypothetical protein KME21_12030 [Desmonostoc vinosum HA7617-LM4]|nr:hypothetical protein [Desmonostoc vinosum HA7617-LM4]